jgi:L-lactate dehydrogenase complex protein LldE
MAVRVALFITCFNDTLFPETGQATVEVLERLGVEVDFPYAQTCCGQMHFNTGYQRETIPLVRRFVEIFGGYEAVVAPSGSCVSMVRELYPISPNRSRNSARKSSSSPSSWSESSASPTSAPTTRIG